MISLNRSITSETLRRTSIEGEVIIMTVRVLGSRFEGRGGSRYRGAASWLKSGIAPMSTRVVGVRAAWGIVRPHPPHDHPDIPVPGHPAPSHPQALVLRYWWQAPAARPGRGRIAGIGAAGPVGVGSGIPCHRLRRMTMGPNVTQSHPEHEPDTRLGTGPCRSPPFRPCAGRRRERRPLFATSCRHRCGRSLVERRRLTLQQPGDGFGKVRHHCIRRRGNACLIARTVFAGPAPGCPGSPRPWRRQCHFRRHRRS